MLQIIEYRAFSKYRVSNIEILLKCKIHYAPLSPDTTHLTFRPGEA
jgi:hypothetical protein